MMFPRIQPRDSVRSRKLFVLVDEDVAQDKRVLQSLNDAGADVSVIDLRECGSRDTVTLGWGCILFLPALLVGAIKSSRRRLAVVRRLRGRITSDAAAGILSMSRWLRKALGTAFIHRQALMQRNANMVIHAHDLYCGLAAAVGGAGQGANQLIYDAHELEIHRNRKAGWLRVLFEHSIEQYVVYKSTEVRVVNQAIADVMRQWYHLPEDKIKVVYNDYYNHHSAVIPPVSKRPAMVYVGKGMRGRQLELLDRPIESLGFDVYMYVLGASLPDGISGQYWRFGLTDYESDLRSLVSKTRSLMWCCLQATSLSYELATPNKFFQAMAVGIPIVASEGTYLGEIVEQYSLGVVFKGQPVAQIANDVMSSTFEKWVEAVSTFRDQLRRSEVVI
jgi:glycosyltransferase involved in cell wall biosynthesis